MPDLIEGIYVYDYEEYPSGTTVKAYKDMVTHIKLAASNNPAAVNSSVTITATFQNYEGSAPTYIPAQVTFSVGGVNQIVQVVNNQAQTNVSSSTTGNVTVSASGDGKQQNATIGVTFQ